MAVRLSEVESAYFIRKLGEVVTPNTHLNDVKTRYWTKFVSNLKQNATFSEMEEAWIMKVLADAGIVADVENGPDWDDDWKMMVASIGKTPSKYLNENKLTFYLNAP